MPRFLTHLPATTITGTVVDTIGNSSKAGNYLPAGIYSFTAAALTDCFHSPKPSLKPPLFIT
jgi:hypothetical protein